MSGDLAKNGSGAPRAELPKLSALELHMVASHHPINNLFPSGPHVGHPPIHTNPPGLKLNEDNLSLNSQSVFVCHGGVETLLNGEGSRLPLAGGTCRGRRGLPNWWAAWTIHAELADFVPFGHLQGCR